MKSAQMLLSLIVVIVLSAIAATLYAYVVQSRAVPQVQAPVVNDFVACEQAGYPVMESYPRQCQGPDGRSFVENISVTIEADESTSTATATATSSLAVPTNVELQ